MFDKVLNMLCPVTHKNKQTQQDKEKPRYKLYKRAWNSRKTFKQALHRNQILTYKANFPNLFKIFFAYQFHANFL